MPVRTIRLPDIGEGVAQAELTEWCVGIGQTVREDDVLALVMTDKAAVEIPSSVSGRVVWLGGAVGDLLAIGSDLIRIADDLAEDCPVDGLALDSAPGPGLALKSDIVMSPPLLDAKADQPPPEPDHGVVFGIRPSKATLPRPEGEAPLAAPSVRRRARAAGVDLRQVAGTGPASRITHDDLDRLQTATAVSGPVSRRRLGISEEKVTRLRRMIAKRMSEANSAIPHITIVEEVDVTELETLRGQLNRQFATNRGKLTLIPFLLRAITTAVSEHPALNAHFDDEAGIIRRYEAVHCGIATQTPAGLMVPVIRHAEAHSLWTFSAELQRLANAARAGTATRDDLSGSTITVSSLGPLGALATTPIINRPEVAIIGINKIATRPFWNGSGFVPRRMMNLSSSFDHRVIDGWDAAVFIRTLKRLIETPAVLLVEE